MAGELSVREAFHRMPDLEIGAITITCGVTESEGRMEILFTASCEWRAEFVHCTERLASDAVTGLLNAISVRRRKK